MNGRSLLFLLAFAVLFSGCPDTSTSSDVSVDGTDAQVADADDAADTVLQVDGLDAVADAQDSEVDPGGTDLSDGDAGDTLEDGLDTDGVDSDTVALEVDPDGDSDGLDASEDTFFGDLQDADGVDADAAGGVDADAGGGVDADADATLDAIETTDSDADTGPVEGPFDDLEGLTGDALRSALLDRIDDHTALGYGGDGTAREYMYAILDVVDGRVECIYTGRTIAAEDVNAPPLGTDETLDPIDTTPEQDCRFPTGDPVPGGCFFNTEHSWPQSDGADLEPAKSDIHHLFPTYELANSTRSNYAFGDTGCQGNSCTWDEGGSELGFAGGYTAFEVRPSHRGDVARAQFYFAVRYAKSIPPDVEEDLRGWHAADPPDDAEIARNEGIYAVQGNRNPFVSRPDFVALIADF